MKNLFSNRFPVAIISLLLILPLLASSCNKAENTDVSTYDNDSKIQDSISADANPGSEITVYITETGNKYHRAYCQYLRESKIEITLDLAIAFGYSRCSICILKFPNQQHHNFIQAKERSVSAVHRNQLKKLWDLQHL